MATNKDKNLEDYLKKMKKEKDIIPAPVTEEKFSESKCISDALREMAEEEKKLSKPTVVDEKKKLDTALATSSNNPYIKARVKILSDWRKNPATVWRANEVDSMEAGKQPKNRHYDDFVKMVVELGDTL
jgi:hypothetical protein